MQLMNYFRDVIKEARNVNYPDKKDIKVTSIVVLVLVVIFMFFISFTDFFIAKLIRFLLGIYNGF